MPSDNEEKKIPLKNRKGIIFLDKIPYKISFENINLFFGKFGQINKSFFLSITDYEDIRKRKIIGLIEYTNKIKAKKTALFFRKLNINFFGINVKYLKNLSWKKLNRKLKSFI